MYDGKYFIVIKGEQWVGIYNIDSVRRIVIDKYESEVKEYAERI